MSILLSQQSAVQYRVYIFIMTSRSLSRQQCSQVSGAKCKSIKVLPNDCIRVLKMVMIIQCCCGLIILINDGTLYHWNHWNQDKKQIALSNRTTGRQSLTADSCFKPFNSNSNGCSILESRDVISYDPYVYNWL